MQTRRERLFWRASLLGHVLLAVAMLALALLLVPGERRDGRFWAEVAWVIFLMGLRWSFASGYLALAFPRWRAVAGLGGVMPGFGVLITGYTLLSGLLMMASTWLGPGLMGDRLHLAIQVGMFTGAALIAIGLYLITVLAAPRSAPPAGVPSPLELAAMVRALEFRLAPRSRATSEPASWTARGALRSLREAVEHTLPAGGPFLSDAAYIQLAAEIQLMCLDTGHAAQLRAGESQRDQLAARATELQGQVVELAGRLRIG